MRSIYYIAENKMCASGSACKWEPDIVLILPMSAYSPHSNPDFFRTSQSKAGVFSGLEDSPIIYGILENQYIRILCYP